MMVPLMLCALSLISLSHNKNIFNPLCSRPTPRACDAMVVSKGWNTGWWAPGGCDMMMMMQQRDSHLPFFPLPPPFCGETTL
uniref:Putative secreted protein n=1 Tax=Anopheles triannulatus TaxID=58253 RepID=A0A2M4B726_9DIPT